jgi:predicted aspartyl protease
MRRHRRTAATIATLVVLLALLAAAVGVARAGSRGHAAARDLTVKLSVLKRGKNVIALVPVTINGRGPFTFALDTGASRSLVDSAVARKLQVPKKGSAGKVAGVGSITKASLVKVTHWRVGDVALPATTIVSSNIPFGNASTGIQGLLGSDMLSRFDVITIDYGKGELRLHPR